MRHQHYDLFFSLIPMAVYPDDSDHQVTTDELYPHQHPRSEIMRQSRNLSLWTQPDEHETQMT